MRFAAVVAFLISGCVGLDDPEEVELEETTSELSLGWCNEQPVAIFGLPQINVEEPFIRAVGTSVYLYFSDRLPNELRDLHHAIWINNFGFVYLGPLSNVNTPAAIEGAPSIDPQGNLYFTDSAAPGMISRGWLYQPNTVLFKAPLPGVPAIVQVGNHLEGNMDLGVAPNHPFAALSRATWLTPSPGPQTADLWYLRRNANGSVTHVPAETAYFFGALNTPKLEYAPELSSDGLAIFYTQTDPQTVTSRILTATRARVDLPFASPRVLATNTPGSLIEGPTVTADRVFFHKAFFDGTPSQLRTLQRCLVP